MRLFLNGPGNVVHSNLFAGWRRRYIEGLGDWIKLFSTAPMPFGGSYQRTCLELARISPDWVRSKIPLFDGPLGHVLPTFFDRSRKNNKWIGHVRAQFCHGVKGGLRGSFLAEYDAGRKPFLGTPGNIVFVPGQGTVGYSECVVEIEAKSIGKLKDFVALQHHGYTVVPMWGAEALDLAFKVWQRFPYDQGKRDALIAAIRKVGDDPSDHIAVLYLDIEAPMVGSNFGMEIWEEFFRLVRNNDISKVFISFEEASEIWRSRAVRIEGASSMFARELIKWTVYAPQIDFLADIHASEAPTTPGEHFAATVFTASDPFSAMHRRLAGDITLSAEGGDVVIGHDHTIIAMARLGLKGWQNPGDLSRDLAVVRALREAPLSEFEAGADGQWMARRYADAIENFAA